MKHDVIDKLRSLRRSVANTLLSGAQNVRAHALMWVLILLLTSFLLSYNLSLKAPKDFPVGEIVVVEEGTTLSSISKGLKSASVIRSRFLFESFVVLFAGDGGAIAGEYFLKKPMSSFGVARRIAGGQYGLAPVSITIPEGSTVRDIAELFAVKFPEFEEEEFLSITRRKEGYLFPDTYLFLPNVHADQVVREMEENFRERIGVIEKEILDFGKPLEDIVTMASLLEKEARTMDSRRLISGILWKRIEIGMPLQVDAVFPYILGKNTYQLTREDLNVDSPYNTYRYKGLPAGPIANPGMDSIRAALAPEESPYLFYLSDRSGNMYYSADFEGHKKNKRLYLN
ncbi:MAG: endolytic transglycosylase MltG [Patescibacteria group bacterium]|nr:MAG: endolytic transglycosylase MltG [Patescibacteria group bacterium]